jgi:CheY-like chemotaxis protein
MSEVGQSRRFAPPLTTSGLPPTADITHRTTTSEKCHLRKCTCVSHTILRSRLVLLERLYRRRIVACAWRLDSIDPDQRLADIQGGPLYASGLDTDMMARPTVVIVVDDNAGLLKSVARLLAHHGIDSRTFASAEALLESDSMQTATCLLLDIHLGGISGIELQRWLAASGSKRPVIFMTASDDEATRNEAMDAGCIAYLRKPFAGQVLLDAIGKAVA